MICPLAVAGVSSSDVRLFFSLAEGGWNELIAAVALSPAQGHGNPPVTALPQSQRRGSGQIRLTCARWRCSGQCTGACQLPRWHGERRSPVDWCAMAAMTRHLQLPQPRGMPGKERRHRPPAAGNISVLPVEKLVDSGCFNSILRERIHRKNWLISAVQVKWVQQGACNDPTRKNG